MKIIKMNKNDYQIIINRSKSKEIDNQMIINIHHNCFSNNYQIPTMDKIDYFAILKYSILKNKSGELITKILITNKIDYEIVIKISKISVIDCQMIIKM